MLEKLEAIEKRFLEVQDELARPDVISDMQRFAALNREYKELNKIVVEYHRYRDLLKNLAGTKQLLATEKDEEMREMAKAEIMELEPQAEEMAEKIRQMLIPKDPEDSKDVILEIRAGTGGDEACLFAGDLFRMYQRFAERKGWKVEVNSVAEGATGGYKEVIATVSGEDAYGYLKYESGVHRVQRVPATETMGRIHTSAATVVAMPEMDDIDIKVNESDVRTDTFMSSGPGGQSVNTTYSAVRLTHIPTGIIVSMQDEKSQLKNKEKAWRILKARLYDIEMQKRMDEQSKMRKTFVASGDRSAKIRTYNFPQSRVTDHRIGRTTHDLPYVIDGDLTDLIEAIRLADNAEKLKAGQGA